MEISNIDFLYDNEKNLSIINEWFKNFYSIGTDESGGVTRLGYTKNEDIMHGSLRNLARSIGLKYSSDEVGNTYVYQDDYEDCYMIASHLDSVINGGRYDGVAGIVAGLLILKWIKENNIKIPVKLCAFRCEESSMYGIATVGSALVTHKITHEKLKKATNKEGVSLYDALKKRGYSPECKKIDNIKGFFELHIEQGRILEIKDIKIGFVSHIAAPTRYWLTIEGRQDHSGATPMDFRMDALCAGAMIITKLEEIANIESINKTVGTIGYIDNYPNAFNVISGKVKLGIDIRGIDKNSIDRVSGDIKEYIAKVCSDRKLKYDLVNISSDEPVKMNENLIKKMEKAANKLSEPYYVMPSGAGHDAMKFVDICPTGMIFIPCRGGISHNKDEMINYSDLLTGTKIIFETLISF
ncbi:MAG: M20 family metallo-hydrolase [Fusobacteriaceae bacterium]|jgi:N-carbamoyl-L-amino-acid hydrolase|nr:M20 family metallo-hydrolase [Fusobacteriaceae bacterium]